MKQRGPAAHAPVVVLLLVCVAGKTRRTAVRLPPGRIGSRLPLGTSAQRLDDSDDPGLRTRPLRGTYNFVGMLTAQQLEKLRSEPGTNRVAKAISLAGVTQVTVAEAVALSQPYVSDVARQRYRTITVDKARRFADYFGCRIEDLFPPTPTQTPP